jgi:hypothetical protein
VLASLHVVIRQSVFRDEGPLFVLHFLPSPYPRKARAPKFRLATMQRRDWAEFLELRKSLHNTENVLAETAKQYAYWSVLEGTNFLESYRKGELAFILNADVCVEGNNHGTGAQSFSAYSESVVTVLLSYFDSSNISDGTQLEKKHMFVRDVEIVKDADYAVVRSVVRLYVGHQKIEKVGRETVYLDPVKGRFQFLPAIAGRELSFVSRGLDGNSFGSFKPSEIQCGAEIVNCVTHDQRKFLKVQVQLGDAMRQMLESSFRVYLDTGSVSFFQREQGAFYFRDVLVGPFHLQGCATTNVSHD